MDHALQIAEGLHVEVYRILDDALGQSVPSPGWRGGIHAVIDELRQTRAAGELLYLAETISLNLHQLEWARKNGNRDIEDEARQGLADVAAAWLNFRILH